MKGKQPNADFSLQAVIASGTTSGAVDLSLTQLVGLITPTSMAGTTLKFLSSDTIAGTYRTLRDTSNADISITIDGTSRQIALNPTNFVGVRYLKIVSSASETAQTITLVTRPDQ